MEQYIISLFQNISWLTIALLGAGVLLCIVEIFVPKFGHTGVFGILLVICGVSSYYLDGFKFKQIIVLVSIITLIIALFIIIELILENKGVINNPDRFKFRTYNHINIYDLVGKVGRAVTNIDYGGTIEVEGKLYYAISNIKISANSVVEIIGIQNKALIVKLH